MKRGRDLIDREFVDRLREVGVLIFDVDDTLLARRGGSTADGDTFDDSPAAKLLPRLIEVGVRVALVTGHGLGQLERRLIEPMHRQIGVAPEELGKYLFAYANAGATRVSFSNDRWEIDTRYSARFRIGAEDMAPLLAITDQLVSQNEDLSQQVAVREGSIVSVRSESGGSGGREATIALGQKLLTEAGLEPRYRIAPAGKTTIEISRIGFSKSFGCKDVFQGIAAELGVYVSTVVEASLYIGDEFESGGNDLAVAEDFPNLTCLSVGKAGGTVGFGNIYSVTEGVEWGPAATRIVIDSILETLD